jgi:cellulose biosynthesis protein BcsQ
MEANALLATPMALVASAWQPYSTIRGARPSDDIAGAAPFRREEPEPVQTIAVFNNKGGVGKSTLTFHAASALAELGKKTLLIDLDPQSNLTLFGLRTKRLDALWQAEEDFIQDFEKARAERTEAQLQEICSTPRSIHFLLKATEDGTGELPMLPPPLTLRDNLDLIPGRLSLHMYEERIASRWSDAYRGDPLAIRTITRLRRLCAELGESHGYEYILVDTSPSLGILNKVVISTVDGFIIPCAPDVFSLYGIRNIGHALSRWKREFDTLYLVLSSDKRASFPAAFVQFIGYTIYNARKRTGQNEYDLATAHYNYASQIPGTIFSAIAADSREHLTEKEIRTPVGGTAVMHSHNTLPNMAQKYKAPIWRVPLLKTLQPKDAGTIQGNRAVYERTRDAYTTFAKDLQRRAAKLKA